MRDFLRPASAAMLVVILSGCAGSSEPSQDASISAGSTPTVPAETASPLETELPQDNSEPDPPPVEFSEAAAEKAAEQWWAAVNYARTDGDLAPLDRATSPECEECTDLIDSLAEASAAGLYADTDPFIVRDSWAAPLEEDTALVFQWVEEAGYAEYDDGDLVSTQEPGETGGWAVVLEFDESGWQTYGYLPVSAEEMPDSMSPEGESS